MNHKLTMTLVIMMIGFINAQNSLVARTMADGYIFQGPLNYYQTINSSVSINIDFFEEMMEYNKFDEQESLSVKSIFKYIGINAGVSISDESILNYTEMISIFANYSYSSSKTFSVDIPVDSLMAQVCIKEVTVFDINIGSMVLMQPCYPLIFTINEWYDKLSSWVLDSSFINFQNFFSNITIFSQEELKLKAPVNRFSKAVCDTSQNIYSGGNMTISNGVFGSSTDYTILAPVEGISDAISSIRFCFSSITSGNVIGVILTYVSNYIVSWGSIRNCQTTFLNIFSNYYYWGFSKYSDLSYNINFSNGTVYNLIGSDSVQVYQYNKGIVGLAIWSQVNNGENVMSDISIIEDGRNCDAKIKTK